MMFLQHSLCSVIISFHSYLACQVRMTLLRLLAEVLLMAMKCNYYDVDRKC